MEITTPASFISGKRLFADFLQTACNANVMNVFERLTALYFDINAVINISAIRNEDDVYIKHYLDSVAAMKFFSGDCCDVGCGGGFPCLPLSIVTKLNFLGIDGVGKKLALISRAKAELGLNNITAEHARSEDLAKQHRVFDTVCSRAVADTDKSLSFCAPLAKPNGKVVLYKSQNDERASSLIAKKNNVTLCDIIDYNLFGTDIKRRLFVYEKK